MAYVPPFPTRHELLTLAMLELARERGVHDMSIRALAAAVRAAPGSLTYHHGDKDTMFATCARFLGSWLWQDMENRMAMGGWARLLPEIGNDASLDESELEDELEYARRLRVWIQLSAYSLDSPAVASVVNARDQQMMGMLDPAGDGASDSGLLAVWSMTKALMTALLQPGTGLTHDAAVAALTGAEGLPSDFLGRPRKER